MPYSETIQNLELILSSFGEVTSITSVPSADPAEFNLLAVMKHPQDAASASSRYGFVLFGYTSLFIPSQWVKEHIAGKRLS